MIGKHWRKSSRSTCGSCVEVRLAGDAVEVRDSKNPDGPRLLFTLREWHAFVGGAEGGEFRLPPGKL